MKSGNFANIEVISPFHNPWTLSKSTSSDSPCGRAPHTGRLSNRPVRIQRAIARLLRPGEDNSLEIPCGRDTMVSWLGASPTSDDDTEPSSLHLQSMLEVEHAIDARLSEHAGDVVRVVHTPATSLRVFRHER